VAGQVTIDQIEGAVAAYGETLLGVEQHEPSSGRRLTLNPERDKQLTLTEADRLCVLIRDSESKKRKG
jgi:hypothetical protein